MVRKGTFEDLDRILEIYSFAREFMRETGNPNQWKDSEPRAELIMSDLERGDMYVLCEAGVIHAVWAFIVGEDSTYGHIDGAWLSDEPYGTFHRVASDGTVHDVLTTAIENCGMSHLRIDTHKDNKVMQHVIEKNGFTRCGIIYLPDGDPRIAYEKDA